MRELRGIPVRISPFRYNPITETIRVYESLVVRVYADGIDFRNSLDTAPSIIT